MVQRWLNRFQEPWLCYCECLCAFPAQLSSESWVIRGGQANQNRPWQRLFVQPVFDVFHCLPLWESCAARAVETLPGNQLCFVFQVKDQIMEPCNHLLLANTFPPSQSLMLNSINGLRGRCVTDRHTIYQHNTELHYNCNCNTLTIWHQLIIIFFDRLMCYPVIFQINQLNIYEIKCPKI